MAEIERDVRRADEFLEGVETILSRDPESGFRLEESSVWFIAGHTVDVALYYTFDENHVYFLSIRRVVPLNCEGDHQTSTQTAGPHAVGTP